MIKNALIAVVALAGLTVSAASQQRVEARQGRVAANAAQVARAVRVQRGDRRPVYRPAPARGFRPVARVTRYPAARRQVWIPGYWEVVRTPARFGWSIGSFGFRVWGVIEPACSTKVWRPGHWAPAGTARRVVTRRY